MFIFADFVQKADFEGTQFEKMGIALPNIIYLQCCRLEH